MKQDYENCTTYSYDAQGSLLSEQSTDLCKKYLYNDFHQCIRTEVIRGREEEAERILQENRYDGEGLRFSLIENGKRTDFITNGWDNLAELDENGQVTKRIIRGMGIVASEDAEVSSNATEATGNIVDATSAFAGTSAYHYYHGNERMDVESITDEAGKVVNGYTYDAFGTIVTSSEKLQNRYTYNGEAFDKTTEQYYLRKRFYNPKLSRFIQEDEYRGDGLNLYAFCANNPVMYVDPSGYFKASENIYDHGNAYTRGDSSDLKVDIISKITGGNITQTVKLGSHQAQHLVPNSCYKHPAVVVSGYQVDHHENGIMAINRNSKTPNAMNDFLANNKYISDDLISKYVTNNTQHGYANSSFNHEAYNDYVNSELDAIAKKYGISDCTIDTYEDYIKMVKKSGKMGDLQNDMTALNEFLRQKHIEGIDLYLQNDYNTKNKNYYEGDLTKEQAQKKYEEENFKGSKCGKK